MICRARLVRAIAELGLTGYGLAIHPPVLVDPDLRVKAAHAVEANHAAHRAAKCIGVGVQFAVSIDKTKAIVLSEFAIDAHDAEISSGSGKRIRVNHASARRAIIGQHRAYRPWPLLAGKPDAKEWIDNAPGKDQLQRRLKVVGIFLEEGTFFRKENFKALVHRDLRIVRFNLAEVKIESDDPQAK